MAKKTNPFAAFAGKAKTKTPADPKAVAALVKKTKDKKTAATTPANPTAPATAKKQFPELAGRVAATKKDAIPATKTPTTNNFAKVLAAAKAKKKKKA